MVAASKNFRAKRKQRQVISAQFSRNSAASVTLRATQYRGVQSNNVFVSLRLCGENRSLGSVDQNGNTLKHDAWNRLVSVTNSSGQIIAKYSYDARGYRVSETYPQGGSGVPAGTTNYQYYDSNWQQIEVRTNGTAASDVTSQTVWSAAYVNSPVLQDTYTPNSQLPSQNSRIYFLHDANWDTAATLTYNSSTSTWNIAQRYVYSPYGSLTILNADFSTPPAGTQPISDYLYQGMTLDAVTGLYYARNRNYSPSLGIWISQDPAQYVNGANTYQFGGGSPADTADPTGAFFLVDNIIFAVGGAIYGVATQAATDLASGHWSSWQVYTGDAVGGAVGGIMLDNSFNPELAGAAAAAVGNAVMQVANLESGTQAGFNWQELATATAAGAAAGSLGRLLPASEVPGLNSGRNSFKAIYNSIATKAENGTINQISLKTVTKMFLYKTSEDWIAVKGVIEKGLEGLVSHQKAGGSATATAGSGGVTPSSPTSIIPNSVPPETWEQAASLSNAFGQQLGAHLPKPPCGYSWVPYISVMPKGFVQGKAFFVQHSGGGGGDGQ